MNLYRVLSPLVRLFFPKMRVMAKGVEIVEPAIFVANHANSYGPIALSLYLPARVYPWVMHDLMDRRTCARHLEEKFIIPELRLPRPLSSWLARLIAGVCVSLFNSMEAIPVYKNSHRVMETISRSIIYLEEGRNLLIFPENPDVGLNGYINRFNTGFIRLANQLGRDAGQSVNIYPVSVNPRRKTISIGRPSRYDFTHGYHEEKARIEAELEAEISSMLEADSGRALE